MKNRFSTIDIFAAINELNTSLKGSRVGNIYDVNHRVYLLKFSRDEVKRTLLIESGIRFHLTTYEWPKNPAPSSFSMKLRKHTRNKFLLGIQQLGLDRIVDFQFGFSSILYHVIVEFYDRGNIFLCDAEYNIMNALRPRTDQNTDVKFIVGQKYPIEDAKSVASMLTEPELTEFFSKCKPSDPLKRVLIPHTLYGPSLIDHCLRLNNLVPAVKVNAFDDPSKMIEQVLEVLNSAEHIFEQIRKADTYESFVTYKLDKASIEGEEKSVKVFIDFNPYRFNHITEGQFESFNTFNEAVDCFFSLLEGQRIDAKTLQQERQILKKLDNIRVDHEQRLKNLETQQIGSRRKGELIKLNLQSVEKALTVIRSALANKMSWSEVNEIVQDAKEKNDPVASKITRLKLDVNRFEMKLSDDVFDQFYDEVSSSSEGENESDNDSEVHTAVVEIDISKSAYANARVYFDSVRVASQKEQKTIEASKKAFQNAEKATQQSLKQIDVTARIEKLRKSYWFEKFLWFISSDNFIVIGGHDQQQNELLVKKYLTKGDLYVHADIHGATSVIIKNPKGGQVPPRTLQEAASMAVCYSSAWDAKIWQSAWWVHANQVSKTAPSGEYLTTGSFMVRGKRNQIAQPQLVMGFGFMFCLEEQSIPRHKGERGSKYGFGGSDTSSVSDVSRQQSLPGSICGFSDNASVADNDTDVVNENSGEGGLTQEQIDELFNGISSAEEEEEKSNTSKPKTDDNSPEIKTYLEDTSVNNKSDYSSANETALKEDKNSQGDNQKRNLKDDSERIDGNLTVNATEQKMEKSHEDSKENKLSVESSQDDKIKSEAKDHSSAPAQMKRGQRNKLKKMKQKYGDQDDEERETRMALLASAGPVKEKKKKKEAAKCATVNNNKNRVKSAQPASKILFAPNEEPTSANPQKTSSAKQNIEPNTRNDDDEDDDVVEELTNETDRISGLLDELTGSPVPEDELLFALPVCAPYSALSHYKFKVKLIPGTGKRGKVVKTALHMFSSMKETAAYEKTLINAVKDGDLTRNVPGKVKLSAPNLNRNNKKN